VFGHINVDHIFQVESLPVPETFTGVRTASTSLGGTGMNIASSAAQLGVPVRLVARVGDDFPEDMWHQVEEHSIDTSFVERARGPTPRVWVFTDPDGRQSGVVLQGVMGDARTWDPRSLEGCEWVHLCTYHPSVLREASEAAARAGMRVAFDPAQEIHYRYDRETLQAIVRSSDLIFGNRSEIERMCSVLSTDLSTLSEGPAVVVTMGSQGCRLYLRGQAVHYPASEVEKVVDPTGAGDAFRGGFYAALFRGIPLEEAPRYGNAAGSLSVEQMGAMLRGATWEEVTLRASSTR